MNRLTFTEKKLRSREIEMIQENLVVEQNP